jgi:hypothetical protein
LNGGKTAVAKVARPTARATGNGQWAMGKAGRRNRWFSSKNIISPRQIDATCYTLAFTRAIKIIPTEQKILHKKQILFHDKSDDIQLAGLRFYFFIRRGTGE